MKLFIETFHYILCMWYTLLDYNNFKFVLHLMPIKYKIEHEIGIYSQ